MKDLTTSLLTFAAMLSLAVAAPARSFTARESCYDSESIEITFIASDDQYTLAVTLDGTPTTPSDQISDPQVAGLSISGVEYAYADAKCTFTGVDTVNHAGPVEQPGAYGVPHVLSPHQTVVSVACTCPRDNY